VTKLAMTVALAALAAGGCRGQENKAPEPGARPTAEASAGRVRVVAAPATGDVRAVVRDAVLDATGAKRRVVVYVGASWCEPCQRFHHAAANGELDATFPDVTLLEFDLDRDRERLALAGYGSKYIPLFALPAPDGGASGRQVEGAIKGEGAVAFLAPKLRALLGP
jgi:hypothetical protein